VNFRQLSIFGTKLLWRFSGESEVTGRRSGYGNVGRNCFRGPWQRNLDFSLGRKFSFGDHQTVKFSTEFFNLTNTPSFANPSVVDIEGGPSAFGRITSTVGTPRLVQFALRYSF
jgi:hypothetical protein